MLPLIIAFSAFKTLTLPEPEHLVPAEEFKFNFFPHCLKMARSGALVNSGLSRDLAHPQTMGGGAERLHDLVFPVLGIFHSNPNYPFFAGVSEPSPYFVWADVSQ